MLGTILEVLIYFYLVAATAADDNIAANACTVDGHLWETTASAHAAQT
jgi:hypothetical protein